MTFEEARPQLRREPFQPVRIRLKDGRVFDIRYRTLVMAAEAILLIGIPSRDEPNGEYSEHKLWVPWTNVDVIEPLSETASPAV